MWLSPTQIRKWRSDSIEARIYAIAEAEAHAQGEDDAAAADAALNAVFSVLSWLYSRPYSVVKDMILDQYGCETSEAALSGFWQRFSGAWFAERNARNAAAARIIQKEANTDLITDAVMEQVGQKALDLLQNPDPNGKDLVNFSRLLLQHKAQEMDRDKFTAAQRTQVEAGLEALAATIKGNPEAQAAYAKLKQIIAPQA